MHEEKVMKIALLSAIFGIILLFYLSNTQELPQKPPILQDEDNGKTFLMHGTVKGISEKNNTYIVSIILEETAGVIFERDEDIPPIGSKIRFSGKVENYDGKTIINGKNIQIIGNSSG